MPSPGRPVCVGKRSWYYDSALKNEAGEDDGLKNGYEVLPRSFNIPTMVPERGLHLQGLGFQRRGKWRCSSRARRSRRAASLSKTLYAILGKRSRSSMS